ncbi:hypothetical protein FYZ41_04870 [Mobiluncus mulieris]|nr:hypothetical protein [Mobiluncus mulieris]MCV0011508.1 hypothetical protein [Mobiluncus mulieris]
MVCPITLSGEAAKRNYGNHESPRCAARAKPAYRRSHHVEAVSDSNDLLSPPQLRKRRSRNSHPGRAPPLASILPYSI